MQARLFKKLKKTIHTGLAVLLAVSLLTPACVSDEDHGSTPTPTGEAHQYALEQLPSHLAGYFEGFGDLDNSERIYIDGAAYVLTNNEASGVLSDMVPEDTIDKVISDEELERMDDLVFLVENEEISEGFNTQNFTSAMKHLDYTPYVIENPELFETFGDKVKQEDLILYDKLQQNPQDENIWLEIRIPNWDYHYNLWKDGKSLLPLDKSSMQALFPNKEDREMIYRGMWMDEILTEVDVLTGKFYSPSLDVLKNNISVITDGTLYNEAMNAYNNPSSEAHQEARWWYDGQFKKRLASFGDWYETTEYFKKYDEELAKDSRLDKLRFLYGYAIYLELESHKSSPRAAQIYAKAFGDYMPLVSASYPVGNVNEGKHHVEAMFSVPVSIIDEFSSNPNYYGTPIIGPGQTIGFYCTEESMMTDGSDWIKQRLPSGQWKILWEKPK